MSYDDLLKAARPLAVVFDAPGERSGLALGAQMKPLPEGGCTIYRGCAGEELKHLSSGDKFPIAGFVSGCLTAKPVLDLLGKGDAPVRIRVPAGVRAVYHRSEVFDEVVLEPGLLFTVVWVERDKPQVLVLEASKP